MIGDDDTLFIDIGCSQQKKYNQNTYGDFYISKRYPEERRLIAVLSDGLGSGISYRGPEQIRLYTTEN